MDAYVKNFIGIVTVLALFVLVFFFGVSLLVYNGQTQTCARAGHHWTAIDHPVTGDAVERSRECK